MKKTVKIISLILIMVMMAAMLTSCTSDELSFLKTMEKFSSMKSFQSASEVSAVIVADIPEYVQDSSDWPNIKSLLNSFKNFKLVSKSSTSETNDKILGVAEVGVFSEDFMFNTSVFVKMEDDNLIESIKIPTTLRWMLPEKNMNAEYLTIDINEMNSYLAEMLAKEETNYGFGMSSMPLSISPKNIIPESKKLSEAYFRFQSEYAKKVGLSPKVVTKMGGKYTLSFTDETLKLFAKSLVDTYIQNPDAKKDVEAFVRDIITFYDSLYPGMIPTEARDEIYASIADPSQIQAQVDEFFAAMEKLPILGSKGIKIDFTTNPSGYITSVEGHIDLFIDVNAIEAMQYGEDEDADPYWFDILISFKESYTNINQAVKIDFPKLTDENNASYVEILKDVIEREQSYYDDYPIRERPQLQLPAEDGSISIVRYGEILDFGDKKPEMIDGVLFVPLGKMSDHFYFNCRWDFDKNCAIITRNGNDLDVCIGDSVLYGEDYSIILSHDTVSMNDQIYVPFRSFMKAFQGYTNIEWDAEKNAAIIGYLY